MFSEKLKTSIDFDMVSKYYYHNGNFGEGAKNITGHKELLSADELAFCNFCYAIYNASYYLAVGEGKNPNVKLRQLKSKEARDVAFSVFVSALEKEVLSWLDIKKKGDRRVITLDMPKQKVFDNELGGYYSNVADFILGMHGFQRQGLADLGEYNLANTNDGSYDIKARVMLRPENLKKSVGEKNIVATRVF